MALIYSGISCELREVLLKDKPPSMLALSSKATVPVLQVGEQVIDESIDVMKWALDKSDPDGWDQGQLDNELLARNDEEFKTHLDHYKYFDRYPESTQHEYFLRALDFIQALEAHMVENSSGAWYLITPKMSALDAAIFPFVRQFAHVDRAAFEGLPFNKVRSWLAERSDSSLFNTAMHKYPVWQEGQLGESFASKTPAI